MAEITQQTHRASVSLRAAYPIPVGQLLYAEQKNAAKCTQVSIVFMGLDHLSIALLTIPTTASGAPMPIIPKTTQFLRLKILEWG